LPRKEYPVEASLCHNLDSKMKVNRVACMKTEQESIILFRQLDVSAGQLLSVVLSLFAVVCHDHNII
jgi:hypothetical protein